jgi:hypothetical protein
VTTYTSCPNGLTFSLTCRSRLDAAEWRSPLIELVRALAGLASTNGYGEIDFASLLPSLQLTLGKTPDVEPPPS